MFSDTHFHFKLMTEERGVDGVQVLQTLAERNCAFALDIGTGKNDLQGRMDCINNSISSIGSTSLQEKIRNFVYYTAGIWPAIEDIHQRESSIVALQESIKGKNIAAIGECGIDHHWNPSGSDGRCESDFDEKTYEGEKELFQMQLSLANSLSLPVIVHSRDAFSDTMDCLKNVGYHNGIIHCYSYGIEEARQFLDLGWYIALGGGTTYTKKGKMQKMEELIRFIPDDRLLCETDAPYLAPVPFRGQANSPVLVEYVYNFIAAIRNTAPEALSELVDKNIKELFRV